jgi:CRISPR-associated protein (TIGR03986 family)
MSDNTPKPRPPRPQPPGDLGPRRQGTTRPGPPADARTDSQADEFLNPYTFVPAYPRRMLPEQLGDHRPVGHDRLHEDRWTGSIAVTLTVRTPLLLLDTARAGRAKDADEEHFVYPVLTRDGRPHLPATAVKGMLRSAYEAITNSRFGVFGEHEHPLGWRRVADDARDMKPARVTAVESDPDRVQVQILEAARLPACVADAVRYPGGEPPRHGDMVKARIDRGAKGQWTVRSIVPLGEGTPSETPDRNDSGQKVVAGIICVTGRNAVGKKYERLFYSEEKPQTEWVAGAQRRWRQVMRSYHAAHDEQEIRERMKDGRRYGPEEWIGDEPGYLAWSPHLWKPGRDRLEPGTLCYAQTDGGKTNYKVIGLYPVLIPRDAAAQSPAEMLPQDLHPADRYDGLSLADRVFGWVAPNGSGTRPAAYRGRLRIGPVTCEEPVDKAVTPFAGDGLPLAILGQPKPSQGRFYLAEGPDTPERPVPPGISKKDVYLSGHRGLRGRKVYWHHAAIDDNDQYWSEPENGVDPTQRRIGKAHGFREFRRPREVADSDADPELSADRRTFKTVSKEQRDNQNRSVRGWVNKGTTFSFVIQVSDLSETELGALVWLLDPPEPFFHRLGLGKPLGFGSVRLMIDRKRTALHSGKQYVEYYRGLSISLPESGSASILAKSRDEFDAIVQGNAVLMNVRAAFLAAAQGVSNLPVHYPRARPANMRGGAAMPPDPRGRSYEWFTANEKTEKKRVADGRGQSLPAAERRAPLRLYRAEKEK